MYRQWVLTALLAWPALAALVVMVVLTTGMIGVFVALDLFLFYVMWEVMLIPMYFIIGVWGGERRLYAAIKFFVYTFFGSLLMLVAILALVSIVGQRTGVYSFSYTHLTTHTPMMKYIGSHAHSDVLHHRGEVHRNEHDFPHHVKEEQIEGHEHPDHARREHEHQRIKAALARRDVGVAAEHRQRDQERRQQDHK